MISKYKFKEVSGCDFFHEEIPNPIYFPVSDSGSFPCRIREKAEGIIDRLVKSYEKENNCMLGLPGLCLDARIEVYFNKECIPACCISVTIAGLEKDRDICLSDSLKIKDGDPLYQVFKRYFMGRMEESLFMGWFFTLWHYTKTVDFM